MPLYVVTLIATDGPTDHVLINVLNVDEAKEYAAGQVEYDEAKVEKFTDEWFEEHLSGVAMLSGI